MVIRTSESLNREWLELQDLMGILRFKCYSVDEFLQVHETCQRQLTIFSAFLNAEVDSEGLNPEVEDFLVNELGDD